MPLDALSASSARGRSRGTPEVGSSDRFLARESSSLADCALADHDTSSAVTTLMAKPTVLVNLRPRRRVRRGSTPAWPPRALPLSGGRHEALQTKIDGADAIHLGVVGEQSKEHGCAGHLVRALPDELHRVL